MTNNPLHDPPTGLVNWDVRHSDIVLLDVVGIDLFVLSLSGVEMGYRMSPQEGSTQGARHRIGFGFFCGIRAR